MAQTKRMRMRSGGQAGMTLIELMVAMLVLVVGMLALMTLVTTAISVNNRNKLDTGGTMLAQMVLERIAAIPATTGTTMTMTDCNPAGATTFTLATAGAANPGAGANVDANGNIDFTQGFGGVPANYAMRYVMCGTGGTQATYDVRWNVRTLSAFTKLVTVSARQIGVPTTPTQPLYFARPVTLRTVVGN